MAAEMEEGFRIEMAEHIKQENELRTKLAILVENMKKPEEKLAKAKELVLKAKAAYDAILADLSPMRSDKTLIEGELTLLEEKKSKLRQEAIFARAGGGIRPGTGAFVEQMNVLAGDAETANMRKEVAAADALAALEELKKKMSGG